MTKKSSSMVERILLENNVAGSNPALKMPAIIWHLLQSKT
jgi:hypothetical protein